jgi:hypothetical protein
VSAGVGDDAREHVARARFDPHVLGPFCQAKHDQSCGLFARDQRWQFPIDCIVGHGKDMRDTTNAGEGGVPPPR